MRDFVFATVTPVLSAILLLVLPSPVSVGSISSADSLSSSLLVLVVIAISPPVVINLLFFMPNSVVAAPSVIAAESCTLESCHQRLPSLPLASARLELRSREMLPKA